MPSATVVSTRVSSLLVVALLLFSPRATPAGAAEPDAGLTVSWTKGARSGRDFLTVKGADVPGGEIRIWYLEAYCRSGSTNREWGKTVIPHHTELLEARPDGKLLRLRCYLPVSRGKTGKADLEKAAVTVDHVIRAGKDDVTFQLTARNRGKEHVDAVWVQPCIRVEKFTGRTQKTYIDRSFIFLEKGLTTLDKTVRREEAIYRGGQVYVPRHIDLEDVNPRPISPSRPVNGLVGCFSADGKKILATAWEPYQELFQGVIVCLHSDFRLGGLEPSQVKKVFGKIYIVDRDVAGLLERYRRDFPAQARREKKPAGRGDAKSE